MASKLGTTAAQFGLIAAAGMFIGLGTAAQAADLGGDCCADLEERIAELEATTARKGNRKVSLSISGHVNEAVLWWDDGTESNIGQYTNDASRTRFRFKGKAKISSDLTAGYRLEIGVRGANSKRFDQDNDNGRGDSVGLDLRHSTWYIDSKTWGRLWVGLTAGASEAVTELNLSQSSVALKPADVEDLGLGLIANSNGVSTGQSYRRLIGAGGSGTQPGEGNRHNLIRYDTPTIAGFKATANWGEDDNWEMGLRYKGEFGGFKTKAAIAYGEQTDGDASGGNGGNDCAISDGPVRDAACSYLGGSISLMHIDTGLYANFGAGQIDDDNVQVVSPGSEEKNRFYAIEAGIEKKWSSIGKTTFFGQYFKQDGGYLERTFTGLAGNIEDSELESWGFGAVQGIDAAAMQIYIIYRHTDGEVSNANGTLQLDDLDVIASGARIKF